HASARLPFDFGGGELVLHALHVLLHLLRLLHQACHLSLHHDVFSVSLSLRGRIDAGSTDAPKFSINSRTKGSAYIDSSACRCRSARACSAIPAVVGPTVLPTSAARRIG